MIDSLSLYREPFTRVFPAFKSELQVFPAPDGEYQVVLSHFLEVNRDTYGGLIHLFRDNRVIENFAPLVVRDVHDCTWSPDSQKFVVPIHGTIAAFFVCDVRQSTFALIRVPNFSMHQVLLTENDARLRIPDDEMIHSSNAVVSKRFRKPRDIVFPYASMTFSRFSNIPAIPELLTKEREYELHLFEDGFPIFEGRLPSSTDHRIGGRLMCVHHLRRFAEGGDPQSIAWLREIEERKRGHSEWKSVKHYLGIRQRIPDDV